MWLNDVVSRTMFTRDVKKQKLELEAARKLHNELSKKCDRLEHERNKLSDLFKSNQIEVVTKKNSLNGLLGDLKNQKRSNLTTAERLEICKDQINMIQENIQRNNNGKFDSKTELGPITEKLSFKWDVVECLEKKLIATRLQNVEKEEIIEDLKQHIDDLNIEIELLKNSKNELLPVCQMQELLLTHRIREADVVLEFDKLKRGLAIIKQELEEKKILTELEDKESEDSYHIHFNLRDKYHEKLKLQEAASIARTVELQNEIDILKMKIKKLEEIKQDTINRVHFNEEVKVHLHEVKTSIFLRLRKTTKELGDVIEKNKKLEEKLAEDLLKIQRSIDDKDYKISQLVEEAKKLQLMNENSARSNDESMASLNEDIISKLQQEMDILGEKIRNLSAFKGSSHFLYEKLN